MFCNQVFDLLIPVRQPPLLPTSKMTCSLSHDKQVWDLLIMDLSTAFNTIHHILLNSIFSYFKITESACKLAYVSISVNPPTVCPHSLTNMLLSELASKLDQFHSRLSSYQWYHLSIRTPIIWNRIPYHLHSL